MQLICPVAGAWCSQTFVIGGHWKSRIMPNAWSSRTTNKVFGGWSKFIILMSINEWKKSAVCFVSLETPDQFQLCLSINLRWCVPSLGLINRKTMNSCITAKPVIESHFGHRLQLSSTGMTRVVTRQNIYACAILYYIQWRTLTELKIGWVFPPLGGQTNIPDVLGFITAVTGLEHFQS